ncbi:MAG: response regulator transcription factor [Alphaproteobacteria bacterium]|nr:response regulator transcription factor [Alphaproteobacteria bacterium]
MNKTVLVIDDDDMLRRTLAAGLRSEGFDVITADSAEQGEQILNKITVDAIVLDRMMTGRDGLSFLNERRSIGDATPVIMLTALSGPENAIAGLDAGANDYLAKPFQLRELVLRLNNIIRKTDSTSQLPAGLVFADNEFFIRSPENPDSPRTLPLSGEEKKLLVHLTSPTGNIAPAAPMVAKRLRAKLNSVLSNIDIITIRGRGYKMVILAPELENKDIA